MNGPLTLDEAARLAVLRFYRVNREQGRIPTDAVTKVRDEAALVVAIGAAFDNDHADPSRIVAYFAAAQTYRCRVVDRAARSPYWRAGALRGAGDARGVTREIKAWGGDVVRRIHVDPRSLR